MANHTRRNFPDNFPLYRIRGEDMGTYENEKKMILISTNEIMTWSSAGKLCTDMRAESYWSMLVKSHLPSYASFSQLEGFWLQKNVWLRWTIACDCFLINPTYSTLEKILDFGKCCVIFRCLRPFTLREICLHRQLKNVLTNVFFLNQFIVDTE